MTGIDTKALAAALSQAKINLETAISELSGAEGISAESLPRPEAAKDSNNSGCNNSGCHALPD
ncbi:hypothetical protein [Kitasatospora sp. NPDC054795]